MGYGARAPQPHLLLDCGRPVDLVGVLYPLLLYPSERLHEDEGSYPVVEGLGHRHSSPVYDAEGAPGDCWVPHLDAFLLHLLPARGADVDEHVLLLHDLLPLLLREDVGRLRRHDAVDVPLAAPDGYPLAQKHLVPPAPQRVEGEEALVGHGGDHEANLVRVPR